MLRVDSCLLLLAAHAGLHTHTHTRTAYDGGGAGVCVLCCHCISVKCDVDFEQLIGRRSVLYTAHAYAHPAEHNPHAAPTPPLHTCVDRVDKKKRVLEATHTISPFRLQSARERERSAALTCALLLFVLSRSLWF